MKNTFFLIFSLILISCSSEKPLKFTDLVDLVELDGKSSFTADGSSVINGRLVFAKDAVLSDIDAEISLTNANFDDTSERRKTLELEKRIDDRIEAKFNIVSTTKAGGFTIEFNVNQYKRRDSLIAALSSPSSINLTGSASSAINNFIGEVTLEGTLTNSSGKKVSQGARVKFTDLLSDGSPAQGAFRMEQLSSNNESKVSVVYSPGLIAPNQFVTIIVNVIDDNGDPIDITDRKDIYVYSL